MTLSALLSVFRRRPWRLVLLGLVTVLVWCAHYDRWSWAAWQLPTDYEGDAPEVLAEIRAASEGAIGPLQPKVVDRLGAPFGAHWNGYPTPEKPLLGLLGGLARRFGVFAAANFGMVLAQVLAALSFFGVARWLRCRWEWAFAGALLFAFSYHTFHRGLAHFFVAISWTVPLGVLAAGLVARSRRLGWGRPTAWFCLATAAVLGAGNPYNLFFWLQLMGWALLFQWVGGKRRENLAIGLAAMAVAVATFFLANIEYWIHVQEPEALPLVTRNYAGTEMYALKPMEMLIPPIFHRWDAVAFLGQRYVRWSIWRGEVFFPYLGLVGIAGLLLLLAGAVRRLLQGRRVPGAAMSVGWLVVYATVGGITNLVALMMEVQVFRATNRVAIFVSAIVLLYLMRRLSGWTAAWPAGWRLGLAAGLGGFGLLDQIPRAVPAADRAEIAARVASDLDLGRRMEAALGPHALVFQLPVMGFPEVVPPGKLSDYELFRPYLTTETLRFSYGAAKFRARSRWQRDLENVPPATLVKRLESYGFAAIHLNRKGYEDRADQLLRELAGLGYEKRIEGARGHQVVIPLRPVPLPKWPLGRSLTFGQGWHPRAPDGVRWANDDAVISYHNPYPVPLPVELKLVLEGIDRRRVTLAWEEKVVRTFEIGRGERTPVQLDRFELQPGVNHFYLTSDRAAVRLGSGRYQLRTFGLRESGIRAVGAPPRRSDPAQ